MFNRGRKAAFWSFRSAFWYRSWIARSYSHPSPLVAQPDLLKSLFVELPAKWRDVTPFGYILDGAIRTASRQWVFAYNALRYPGQCARRFKPLTSSFSLVAYRSNVRIPAPARMRRGEI
jgi:hypothetical protein